MTAGLADVHDELRAVARGLLGSPVEWSQVAELGWLGLDGPEDLDGSGATFAEVAVILEEMGRATTACSYLGTAVLGMGALQQLDAHPRRDELVRRAVSGERRLAAAWVDGCIDAVGPELSATPFMLEPAGGSFRLHGRAEFVPDLPDADDLLLLARHPDGDPVVVHLTAGHPGIGVQPQPLLDTTRTVGVLVADGAEVPSGEVWRFSGDAGDAVRRVHDRGAVAVACDSLGLSRAMLDATVDYAGARVQFGRPIGSFQAVKHACADMLVQVQVGEELVAAAVAAVVQGDPDASVAASMAKSHVTAAAVDVVGKALQLHGGIGYTWESGIHVYLKRAVLDRSLLGSPAAHRRRLAERLVRTQEPGYHRL